MKKRVYIETTIVSYLTAKPSLNLIIAAHQRITRDWWDEQRKPFDLCASELVLKEAAQGDADAAKRRLAVLEGIALLPGTDDALALAKELVDGGLLPEQAGADALHLAYATINEVDILLTWNCRHLANARILGEIGRCIRRIGYELPIVCTPDELMGDVTEALGE